MDHVLVCHSDRLTCILNFKKSPYGYIRLWPSSFLVCVCVCPCLRGLFVLLVANRALLYTSLLRGHHLAWCRLVKDEIVSVYSY